MSNQKQLVVTYDAILTNIENLEAQDEILYFKIEGKEERIIRHLINCARNGLKQILVCTVYTDVLILLMFVLPRILEQFYS